MQFTKEKEKFNNETNRLKPEAQLYKLKYKISKKRWIEF